MKNAPKSGISPQSWHGWTTLLTTAVLGVAVAAFVFHSFGDEQPKPPVPLPADLNAVQSTSIRVPLPPEDLPTPPLHSVVKDVRQGVAVLRIRPLPLGDELIIDARSGKLIAVINAMGMTTWQTLSTDSTSMDS
mgnify:CR=1 FL=1